MTKPNTRSRRRFLAQLAGISAGSSLAATYGKLELMRAALADGYSGTDYKSLVCVFLFGGNDAHNTAVRYVADDYARYAAVRQGLALRREQLLASADGRYGFHPSLTRLRELYDSGRLALVQNVGNLLEPTARAEALAGRARLPVNLFSHNHQQEIWQTNRAPQPGASPPGWGGRMADLLAAANDSPLPPTFSLFGSNYWQAGVNEFTRRPFGVGYAGVSGFQHFDASAYPPREAARSRAWRDILALRRSNILQQQAATLYRQAAQRLDALRAVLAELPAPTTPYNPNNGLAAQLRQAARLIAARERLGLRRQLFMASLGGLDTHGNQLADHAALLATLDEALYSFYRTTEELGVADSVVTFTASEFGRTLSSNGDGTDHAWAADYLVLGGAVAGGNAYGEPIALYPGGDSEALPNGERAYGPDDLGSGRFIPRYSVEQYGATLARWMGLSAGDVADIMPNLANFEQRDLGFL